MMLLFAILIISFEAITEALIKKYYPKLSEIIFKWWLQWLIALALFAIWLGSVILFNLTDKDLLSVVVSFILIRYFIFDAVYNLTRGLNIFFIGTTKLYDRILQKIGLIIVVITKMIAGFVGIMFLL